MFKITLLNTKMNVPRLLGLTNYNLMELTFLDFFFSWKRVLLENKFAMKDSISVFFFVNYGKCAVVKSVIAFFLISSGITTQIDPSCVSIKSNYSKIERNKTQLVEFELAFYCTDVLN